MKQERTKAEILIKCFVAIMLIANFILLGYAFLVPNTNGEAERGSFETIGFNDGWMLETDDGPESISLPTYTGAEKGELVTITNLLPEKLSDDNCLMIRATMEDVYVYIGDELREQYASENLWISTYYLPSAYVVVNLTSKDAGESIAIQYRVKATDRLEEIQLGAGNNAWFKVIQDNLAVNAAAIVLLVLGIALIIAYVIMRHIYNYNKTAIYLGILMIDISVWICSESKLRQIIFPNPSLSGLFAYLSVELICILTCFYFDEVQHKTHHKSYIVIEAIASAQLLINTVLHCCGIVDYYETLVFSHIWMGIGLLVGFVHIVLDIRARKLKEYFTIIVGMLCFLAMAMLEIIGFYISRNHVFGLFLCVGLIMLMVATIIQLFNDQIQALKNRENYQTQMTINTIKTIAGAIDAKDEYTGGHSDRVGHYAVVLARAMADDYGFTEEDILRIHYIGTLHDIGKIGVPDPILNKAGKLTDDEYTLMKKHVDIGAELMKGIGKGVDGLLDGILYHHERYDGKGYSSGLAGQDIPLIARIICLADCYDAMTSNRVYRKRLSSEEVREEFIRCRGSQFDPELTDIFVKLIDTKELVPYTIDGMATTQSGEILKSAMLEKYLKELSKLDDMEAKNPTHIRMMNYILKLKEKRGESINAFVLTILDKDELWDTENRFVTPYIQADDMNIEYNDKSRIIVLFGKSDEEIEDFEKTLEEIPVNFKVGRI